MSGDWMKGAGPDWTENPIPTKRSAVTITANDIVAWFEVGSKSRTIQGMIAKVAIGAITGIGLGFGYHKLMCAIGSQCINARHSEVPILVLGTLGAVIAFAIFRNG
jgi:hypothetical protein